MRNIRGQAKREAEYYRSNPLQYCQVCHRPFIKRRDVVCSRACLEKQAELAKQHAAACQPVTP